MSTSQLILPGRSAQRIRRAVNAWFLWKASDLSLVAISGQVGVLTRPATTVELDTRLATWSAVAGQPSWRVVASTGGAYDRVGMRLDGVSWATWPTQMPTPPLAVGETLTLYVELDPLWSRTGGDASQHGVVKLGRSAAISGGLLPAGEMAIAVKRNFSSNTLQALLWANGNSVASSAAVPATGVVKLLVKLVPSGGNHVIACIVNGVVGSGSAALVVAGKVWSEQTLELNGTPLVSGSIGDARYLKVVVAKGDYTQAEMEAL
jgi:hypothetical protein